MQKLNLSKIQQCDQYWDFMEPEACGRLCKKCDKLIVDFRQMKDEEVATVHMFSEGPVCGIYRKDQLEAPKQPKPKKNVWKAWSLAAIGLLFAKAGTAQEVVNKEKVEQNDQAFQRDTLPVSLGEAHGGKVTKDSLWINGRVGDSENLEPIIGLTVLIKGTKIGTVTDIKGNYLLNATDAFHESDSITIQYSYVGYNNLEKTISKKDFISENSLNKMDTLTINMDFKGELNILATHFYVRRPPLHKRVWYGVKRFFRFEWLKKD